MRSLLRSRVGSATPVVARSPLSIVSLVCNAGQPARLRARPPPHSHGATANRPPGHRAPVTEDSGGDELPISTGRLLN